MRDVVIVLFLFRGAKGGRLMLWPQFTQWKIINKIYKLNTVKINLIFLQIIKILLLLILNSKIFQRRSSKILEISSTFILRIQRT
jgi:uncharacterized membrane protein YesL